MSANNQVVLIGRVGNDVAQDMRHLQSGTAIASISLAVNRPSKDAMGNPITDWIQVQFWDKNAERAGEFMKKGDLISISGSMRVDTWEKEGEKRSKVFVHGENFQMLESRQAREDRQGSAGSSQGSYGDRKPAAKKPAPAGRAPKEEYSDDFALDDDELPPF